MTLPLRPLGLESPTAPEAPGRTHDRGFATVLAGAAEDLTVPQAAAGEAVDAFVRGANGDLAEGVLALEKADISFRFMVSVRNRLVEAYREVMRMGM